MFEDAARLIKDNFRYYDYSMEWFIQKRKRNSKRFFEEFEFVSFDRSREISF